MQKTPCPLCGSESSFTHSTCPGYQEGQSYDICECPACDTSFSLPLKVDEQIYELIYNNIESVPGYSRYLTYARQILKESAPLDYLMRQEESYWAVGNYLRVNRSQVQGTRILEVGCGMGYFTYALFRDGFDVRGVDISQQAVQKASKQYGDLFECTDLKEYVKKNEKRFDVAIVNQLIEHIPDIRSFIRNILDVLTPHGEIIITTPNKSAYPDDLWETELPPVHLWWLSEKSLEIIAREHGLSLTFADFTEFYKYNYCQKTSLSKCPVFDDQGNFVFPVNAWKTRSKNLLKSLLTEKGYGLLRGNKRIFGRKGPVIAAILKKR
jgi:2-polyprenyl-3-methyl-5-hydroxy-6-metoxy-1,4-benzoquinol methylase